jgi:hypothetical protein
MTFQADMLIKSGLAESLDGVVQFLSAMRNLPIPRRIGQSASTAELRQFAIETSDFFERLQVLPVPAGAGTGLEQAAREIEAELSRTRPGRLTVAGGGVAHSPGGISILPPTQEVDSGDDQDDSPYQPVFAVYTVNDGGVAGDTSTTCTFTYTVYDLDKETILDKNADGEQATLMTPEKSRLVKVKYTTPSSYNLGLAFYDFSGDLILWDANELPYDPEEC